MQVFTASPAAMYTGIGNAFSRISATEGLRALWRGVASVVLGAGPAHAVYFATYEFVKEGAGGNLQGNQWLANCEPFSHPASLFFVFSGLVFTFGLALAGASATIASDALMNPFDGKTLSPPKLSMI